MTELFDTQDDILEEDSFMPQEEDLFLEQEEKIKQDARRRLEEMLEEKRLREQLEDYD